MQGTFVSDLAKELDLTPSEVLTLANQIIEKRYKDGGLAAIEGLSTGVQPRGQVSVGVMTFNLAQLIRKEARDAITS